MIVFGIILIVFLSTLYYFGIRAVMCYYLVFTYKLPNYWKPEYLIFRHPFTFRLRKYVQGLWEEEHLK